MGYGSAVAVILFVFALVRCAALPALRHAPRHRRRHDDAQRPDDGAVERERVRCRPSSGLRRTAATSLRVVLMFAVAAAIIVPARVRLHGWHPDHGRAAEPALRAADDWWPHNYIEVLSSREFWTSSSTACSSPSSRRPPSWRWLPSRPSRSPGWRSRGGRRCYTLFVLGLLFPAAVAILPLFILIRQLGLLGNPLGRGAAAGRLRAAAHHHHPASLLQGHPRRAGGRRRASTAAAGSASSGGWSCRSRDRPWPPSRSWPSWAAGTRSCCRSRARHAGSVDAPAGRHELLRSVHAGHRAGPRLHHAVDGPGARSSMSSRSARSSAASRPGRSRDEHSGEDQCRLVRSPAHTTVSSAAGTTTVPGHVARDRGTRPRPAGPHDAGREDRPAGLGLVVRCRRRRRGIDALEPRQRLARWHRPGHARGRGHQPASRAGRGAWERRSSASSSRRRALASRPSSTRRACTA